jgi:hypothetical protein
VIELVRTIHFNKKLRKVALRKKPWVSQNHNETDVVAYVKPNEEKTVKRIDDQIYYDHVDNEFYIVCLNDGRTGYINKNAFVEVS